MPIEINSKTSSEGLENKIAAIKPKKAMDTSKYVGKIKWSPNALIFQNKQRDEWN